MPLHRASKGDSPLKALSELVRRIERGGESVQQILEDDDNGQPVWLVQSSAPRRPRPRTIITRDGIDAA
jgi:hypothetical protein